MLEYLTKHLSTKQVQFLKKIYQNNEVLIIEDKRDCFQSFLLVLALEGHLKMLF